MIIKQQLIQQRLQQLEAEMAKGQQQLNVLEQRRDDVQNTLLRLSGAMQVLNEILTTAESANPEERTQVQTAVKPPGLAAAG